MFKYPHLEAFFVMKSDPDENTMPENFCFPAFNGKHGLIGKHITVYVLSNSSMEDIRHLLETHTDI